MKNFYLARRSGKLSATQFTRRWRRHGELAMTLPLWRFASGYEHCDVIALPDAEGSASALVWSHEWDGVGIVHFATASDMESLSTDPDFPELLADEQHVFREPVAETAVMTIEQQYRQRPGVAAKVIAFLRPRQGKSDPEFRSAWDAQLPLVLGSRRTDQLVLRYSHNVPVGVDAISGDTPDLRARVDVGLHVAGVMEIGFASNDDLADFVADPAFAETVQHLKTFVDLERSTFVMTNEVVMSPRVRAR